MENQLYHPLTKHFCALCGIPISVVDAAEREILFTESVQQNFFCDQCPNRCHLISTMLYGCNEARRWNGRYVFYCPIGLVFAAITVPETESALLAGPLVMGELQDTLVDLPDYVNRDAVRRLPIRSTDALHHLTSVLEMAVYGLRYRPNGSYDRNVVSERQETPVETAAIYSSFPYMRESQEKLRKIVANQDKALAMETLNELLRYVYAPHPDQFALIKSRAVQLMYLLAKVAEDAGAGETEISLYRREFVSTLKGVSSLEEMDIAMTEILHHFMDYLFDFSQIKHSDTVYRVMEYVKSNYAKKITLEDIASYVYLSGSHISSIFHKETGQTIFAYISQVRIEKSKDLLRQAGIPIVDVAARCGFEDQSYFTRVFKKQTGISPKRYRDNVLREPEYPDAPGISKEKVHD